MKPRRRSIVHLEFAAWGAWHWLLFLAGLGDEHLVRVLAAEWAIDYQGVWQ